MSRSFSQEQDGFVLLLVLIVTGLLVLLGLSLAFTSSSDFSMSLYMEGKTKARMTAEAGYNLSKIAFLGNQISDLLATPTTVPRYMNYAEPAPGTDAYLYFIRNPLAPIEAMNIDFENPPLPIGNRTVLGLLSSASGEVLPGGGRYWAKVTDNDDGDGDFTTDADGTIHLRVLAAGRNPPGEVFTYGGTVKNSLAILEVTLKRDTSFDFSSPFTVYGPDVNASFNGNSFDLDGNPHDLNGNPIAGAPVAGLSVVFDNPGGGDASAALASILAALSGPQTNRIVGDVATPSVQDNTPDIRYDPNPDARNIFDPNWLVDVLNLIGTIAHNFLPEGQYTGGSVAWGTPGDPKITYVDGYLKVTGAGSGAGLLAVKGTLEIGGAFDWDGLVITLGGDTWLHGANKSITGGMFTAHLIDNGDGTYSYGIPTVRLSGNSNVLYSEDALALGYNLLPVKRLGWREITLEMEPK